MIHESSNFTSPSWDDSPGDRAPAAGPVAPFTQTFRNLE
jgi:hypothetical protein